MRLKRRPTLILITIGALLVLLPMLAYLQYEWQGQVSVALRAQMQEQMQRAANQFNDDFGRTLTELYKSFQPVLPEKGAADERTAQLRAQYEKAYARWNEATPSQRLLGNLLLLVPSAESPTTVERLDRRTGKFELASWPDAIPTLRQQANVAIMRFGGADGKMVQIPAPTIDWRIPALVIPIMDVMDIRTQTPSEENMEISFPNPIAEVIIELNLDYIRRDLMPALAKLHLSNPDGTPAYDFAVIDRSEPQRVIYSNSGSLEVPVNGDVTASMYMANVMDSPPAHVETNRAGQRGFFAVRGQQRGGPIIGPPGQSALPWELVLTHRAGSLQTAVAQARTRNLAIGFGILLLLAFSVALTLVSVQRERRIAQQQMDFVSAVSHELRTPLAVICSAGDNLADGVVENSEQARQYGALVHSEGRRLSEMVEQVLDFAGIQSGKSRYRFEPSDVGDLIDRSLAMFESQIQERGFTVEKLVAVDLPPVMADRSAFTRAIQNLISNALKYGDSGKFLSIRAESAHETVAISVEDHGAGIAPIDLPHVFEPFYRGRAARDAQIKGSGLGLSLVKQTLEAHGASIAVESVALRGTIFTICMPRIEPVSDVNS
jgi:signal transduction histidine kinase